MPKKEPDKPVKNPFFLGIYLLLCGLLSIYFVFATIQGSYGVLNKVQIKAEIKKLQSEKKALSAQVDTFKNLNKRLSDRYMDLDLLDERIRSVLGYVHVDDAVIKAPR